jgi:hypothetical protein
MELSELFVPENLGEETCIKFDADQRLGSIVWLARELRGFVDGALDR